MSRYGELGASSRIRFYQYIPYLERQGIHVTVASLLGNEYVENLQRGQPVSPGYVLRAYLNRLKMLFKSSRYDLLWIEGEVLPWLPALCEAILHRIKIPYVVDYDDAIFHRYDMHRHWLVRALLGKKIDRIMRRAALVTVGNHYLWSRAQQSGAKRLEILPSVVDLNRYECLSCSENKPFTIGWVGSPTTAQYLQCISPALRDLCGDDGTRMVLVGAGPIKPEGVPAEVVPWSEETEVRHIRNFDVGIMPLPDELWARGKCGYKLIQYMACGLPVVASPVGVSFEIITSGTNGFLAKDNREWTQALKSLRENPERKTRMGEAGRKKVEKKYCIQVTAPQLATLLRKAAGA